MTVVDEIGRALSELSRQPHGAARIAAAERLVDRAAETGDRPVLIAALQEQISAYNHGGEGERMLVPFARSLKMWEDRPQDFDEYARYRLFWQFKWASTGMIWHADVPLATIEHWLDEMERRYRMAGYGLHPVHSQRHYLANHLGDRDAVARYFDEWVAGERTEMSDCHACELREQGDWYASTGREEQAVRAWTPVLRGERTCIEEPHLTLARSLLPLLRIGRIDEARANHLRGYRLVRRHPNLLAAIGQHIEFAALTGNEARALEMLSEHLDWLDLGSPDHSSKRRGLREAAAILLRRLTDLGQESLELPMPTGPATVGVLLPRVERAIEDCVTRFDRRNGTTAVSDRSRSRLAARPVLASLPLGIRATTALPVPTPVPVVSTVDDVDALIADATRLTDAHDPRAAKAWERVAASGEALPPLIEARIAQSRAVTAATTRPREAVALFLDAADRFAAAGDPAAAIANRARAGLAAAMCEEDPPQAPDSVAELAALEAMRSTGPVDDRMLWVARMCAVRTRMLHWMRAGGRADDPARVALDRDLAALVADAERAGAGFERAEALVCTAQAALVTGALESADSLLGPAIEAYRDAGAPAHAADAALLRGRAALGRRAVTDAESHLLQARQYGGDLLDARHRADIAGLLADVGMHRREHAMAAAEALTAAHLYDDLDPDAALWHRHLAASAFERDGRPAEAAALLESILPDVERRDVVEEVTGVQQLYGRCLQALGEHRAAVKVFASAAARARDLPDQRLHASLTHDAGRALESSNLPVDAEQMYLRAAALWETAGDPAAAVRATRAAAWTLIDRADSRYDEALALFERAATMSPDERPETLYQTVQLVMEWPENVAEDRAHRAVGMADEAADGFRAGGAVERAIRAGLLAADLIGGPLDDADGARTRIARTREHALATGDPRLIGMCDEAAQRWKP